MRINDVYRRFVIYILERDPKNNIPRINIQIRIFQGGAEMHKSFNKYIMLPVAAVIFSVIGLTAFADTTVMVGGEAMYPTKDIVDNAVNSKDHILRS
jgi:hypothetical protein